MSDPLLRDRLVRVQKLILRYDDLHTESTYYAMLVTELALAIAFVATYGAPIAPTPVPPTLPKEKV